MRGNLRAKWIAVRASYWFIPAILTLVSVALAALTIHLDHAWGGGWLKGFPGFESSRPEGARSQLTVIASAMIAISSTVFAITIAAVAYASGTYGPRLLNNFMNDRGNQVSLGVFIATFVYNLLVLRTIRSPDEAAAPGGALSAGADAFVPQLSMLISSVSALFAVGVLVFFLHHVPASIRVNTVLGDIGRRLIRDIERRFPKSGGSKEPDRSIDGVEIAATAIGYIEIIDFKRLGHLAEEHDCVVSLLVRSGEFIHPHLPVLRLRGSLLSDTLREDLLGSFSLGNSPTSTQDVEFLIDELVEIGLRALSPGINDPFTAVTSLHWLAAALAKLADRDLWEGPEQEDYDPRRVRPVSDDFTHYIQRSFGAMRSAAATSPIAAAVFLDALKGVALGATLASRRTALLGEAQLLEEQALLDLQGPSREEVRSRFLAVRASISALAD